MQETPVWFPGREKGRLPTPVFLGFPCASAGKESTCNVGDLGLIPGLGRSPGEGKGYPLQYSGLENSMGSQRVRHNWATLTYFHFLCRYRGRQLIFAFWSQFHWISLSVSAVCQVNLLDSLSSVHIDFSFFCSILILTSFLFCLFALIWHHVTVLNISNYRGIIVLFQSTILWLSCVSFWLSKYVFVLSPTRWVVLKWGYFVLKLCVFLVASRRVISA